MVEQGAHPVVALIHDVEPVVVAEETSPGDLLPGHADARARSGIPDAFDFDTPLLAASGGVKVESKVLLQVAVGDPPAIGSRRLLDMHHGDGFAVPLLGVGRKPSTSHMCPTDEAQVAVFDGDCSVEFFDPFSDSSFNRRPCELGARSWSLMWSVRSLGSC